MNKLAKLTSATLVIAGILICVGWQFRIGFLKGEMLGTFISPNAALLFVLFGISCLLQLRAKGAFLLDAGRLVGAMVVVFAGAIIVEHLFHLNMGIDARFFQHRMSDWTAKSPPGRPHFPTLVAFFIAGIGAVTIRIRRAGSLSDWCATLIGVISYLSLIGYLYGLNVLYGGETLHTAFLMALVATTLYAARSEPGIAQIISSAEAGGVVFRRVVAAIVLLMPLFGFISIRAQQDSVIGFEMGTVLLVVVTVFAFTAITAHTATVLNVLDAQRKRAEEQVVRSEKLAAAGRLSATIAHEVNNPLASVMNLLYLAETANSSKKTMEYIRSADTELKRASSIIKRTLGFYKDEANPEALSLSELVKEVLDLNESLLRSQIQVNAHFYSVGAVYARAGEIRQIIGNLLGNAIDAVQGYEEPEITITVQEMSDGVELSVGDNGSGVPRENLEQIFVPFFTTKKDVGTGLGLYVSRQLAEKNGGTLRVESSTIKRFAGTRFTLMLPLATPVSPKQKQSEAKS
ncbi:MAG: multi-sensor signal transduction histidine kinase [Candidatus Angelobacter sp.]|jgi:signal transduction histidine kinase|nr:multi-sensor signal transduction histidine kinase [Candidatus Angelobacter sp.]